jgi:hypothetical protein
MTVRNPAIITAVITVLVATGAALAADSPADEASNRMAYDILKQLVETNTTDSVGNVTTAVEAMAQRFRDAGFPGFYRIAEADSVDENTVPLAEFLDIPVDKARQIANTHYLFTD